MNGRRLTGVLGCVALLGGCIHSVRGPQASAGPVPAAYAEALQSGDAAEPELKAWWTRFGDPVLTELVGRALEANLDLRTTAARIAEARQQEIVAGARRQPQVQANSSASRNRISEHAIPIPPVGPGVPPAPFALPGAEFSSYHLGVDASWELDLFGGAESGVKAAQARREAVEWSRRDLEVALAAEVAGDYLALRSLQHREAIAWSELERQRKLLSIVSARADAGLAGHVEVEQQKAATAATEARAYPLEAQARAEIHALGVLLGEPPESLIQRLTPAAAAPAAPPAPPPGLPSGLLRRRPDIRRAERNVAAAADDVGVATADLYPRITLSGQPSLVSTSLSHLLEWGSGNYTFSAGLLWPIFEGGRLKAELGAANARETLALLAYRKAVLMALKDVEDALSREQADEARRGSLEASLEDAQAAEGLARDRYRAGVEPYANVLQAEQAVTAGQDQLADAENARAQDVVALYRALGGGWTDEDLKETTP